MNFFRSFLLALFTYLSVTAACAEGQRVILVLDASGSMWGQINGKAKMEIAKSVVGNVIGKWKAEDEIGLVAYGHRKKGSCEDIETLIEPAPVNGSQFMSAVNALVPKGKTPMTQSVRQAAEALKFTEKQATVILVSDGIETCDPSPCAVAEELEKMGVGLTVHTVGFGLDDKGAVAQLKCLAEKTGGISVLADDADQLESALNKTIAAAPAPTPEPVAEFNLLGRIITAENVEALPPGFDQPSWEISRSANGAKGEWLKTEYGAQIKSKIDNPGDYVVTVSTDLAKVEAPLQITNGKTSDLSLSFEAGLITFKGLNDASTPLADGSTTWELLDRNGQWLATKYGPEVSFFASAGQYRIKLSLGDAKVEQDVTFTPGKIEAVNIVLGGGVIDVSAFFAAGGDPLLDGAAIELHEGSAGADGKHKWIATQYGPQVKFKVMPGRYRIFATQDFAKGFADVEVGAGKSEAVQINIDAGYLAVAATTGSTVEVYEGKKDISGKRKWIATGQNGQFAGAVKAGSVFVVAKAPDGSTLGEAEVNVSAGARSEIKIP